MSPRSNMKWVWLLGAMFACAGPATPGCAVERDPINRVQPDYVRKSDLIPSQFAAIQRAGETWRDRSRAPTLNPNVIRDEASGTTRSPSSISPPPRGPRASPPTPRSSASTGR